MKIKKIAQVPQSPQQANTNKNNQQYTVRSMFNDLAKWKYLANKAMGIQQNENL